MKIVSDVQNDTERAFYGVQDTIFERVTISGPKDGESAFKQNRDIEVNHSFLALRYPFWHVKGLKVNQSIMTSTCRAPLWYCENVLLKEVTSNSVKPLRECSNIVYQNCVFNGEEPFWRCHNIDVLGGVLEGFYAFFESSNIKINNFSFKGKYSFQYVKEATIENSNLDTKDAFWHSENVTVKNCVVKGEYLGWYSKNLKLINCRIIGTQPLCYCEGLQVIDCTFEKCDLSFENSEVNGNIIGHIDSIKNPLKGHLDLEEEPNMIVDEFDLSNGEFSFTVKESKNGNRN